MARPSGFDPQHLSKQLRRFALRNVRKKRDKRNRVAALVASREISPAPVVAIDLERSKPAIGAAWIERDNLRADALASGEDARQYGREGRQRRQVDFGRSLKGPPEARQRRQAPSTSQR
jgi:hypothetical protein